MKEKASNEYDVLDIVSWLNEIGKENIRRQNQEKKIKPYNITDLPAWGAPFYFIATSLSKCLRRAGYDALGEKGLPYELDVVQRMRQGTYGHYRFKAEMRGIYMIYEGYLIDPENHILGYADYVGYARDLKTLMVIDLKTRSSYAFRQIKRQNVKKHLLKTNFYPPVFDDEMQVMIYIYLCRRWGIDVRFGIILYENSDNPNQRKMSLVEYDGELMERFLQKVQELEALVRQKKLPEPYLTEDALAHKFCPYRHKCPMGQKAEANKKKKRNIPLWMIYNLKRRTKQEPPAPQLGLFQ